MTRSRMRCLPILLVATLLLACGGDDPTRAVRLHGGLLSMQISEQWRLESEDREEIVFVHQDHDDLRLHIAGETESFGQPLKVTQVKSMLGKELNSTYGGVSTRVSLKGNAMIQYTRELVDEYDDPIHAVEWVLAKPVGFGDFARVEISLRMSPARHVDPETPPLIERLDRSVGDALIPKA